MAIRPLSRSATNNRPRESIAIACGTLNCPGPDPAVPHAFTKAPSLAKCTTRLLNWPSVTNTSPVAVTRTSVGPLNVSTPFPLMPFFPSVIRTLPSRSIL